MLVREIEGERSGSARLTGVDRYRHGDNSNRHSHPDGRGTWHERRG
jgi:hypothetical protein